MFNLRAAAKEFSPAWFKVLYAKKIAPKDSLRGVLGRFKQEPKLIFDIGANIGGVSQIFLETFPSANICAFEPCQNTFKDLKKNLASENSRVQFYPFGFAAEAGSANLNITSSHGANSILAVNEDYQKCNPGISEVNSEPISLRQMDEFVASEKITKIDLVKIDVEGFEAEVLKGGRSTFTNIVSTVIMELSFCRHGFDSPNWLQLLNTMHEFGFDLITVFDLHHTDIEKVGYRLVQMDAVFVRSGSVLLH